MTQEELAARVNSVRETVGRMLKRFAADGIIRIRRGGLLVLDMEKLEKAAV
jgi:CRP/FNR family transcriptional regulator